MKKLTKIFKVSIIIILSVLVIFYSFYAFAESKMISFKYKDIEDLLNFEEKEDSIHIYLTNFYDFHHCQYYNNISEPKVYYNPHQNIEYVYFNHYVTIQLSLWKYITDKKIEHLPYATFKYYKDGKAYNTTGLSYSTDECGNIVEIVSIVENLYYVDKNGDQYLIWQFDSPVFKGVE